MTQHAHNPQPSDNQQSGTARLWLSQRQWMSVLEGTERMARESATEDNVPEGGTRRAENRLPAPKDARCLLRLGNSNSTDEHGIYIVKLRDISASGLGFYSDHAFASNTRCTVALQDTQGHGMVCAASVVWSKPIQEQAQEQLHDVGIRFDQPIDTNRFAGDSPDTPC